MFTAAATITPIAVHTQTTQKTTQAQTQTQNTERATRGNPRASTPADSVTVSHVARQRAETTGQVGLPTTGEQASDIKEVSRWAREVVQQMKDQAQVLQPTQVSNLSREASARLLSAG